MKDSMLKPVRIEVGLGDPPPEYTNNDPESANFLIKHGLHFSACKPHEFVEKIKNIIETQHCSIWNGSVSSVQRICASYRR